MKNKLFNVIPENFFVPLSSPNKNIYIEIIFKINRLVENGLSYGIDKEIIIQEIEEYFEGLNDIPLDEESTNRDKANLYVRKLEEYGWIYTETTNNYKQIINIHDYAISIINSFKKIINNEKAEYQGNIIAIYALLFTKEDMNSGIIIRQVFDNTKELINGLKTLNANIKKYMDELTKHKTPEEVMKALFGEYTKNIIDRAYHRLRTSENISKYRPKILDRLEEISNDKVFLNEAATYYMDDEGLENLEVSIEKVQDIVFEIVNAFNNIDEIMEEIDNKNTKYQRASVTRAKFLLNNSTDVTGQIKNILNYACDQYKELNLKLSQDYLDEMTDLFTLYSQGYIDESSLYTSNEGKKSFKPQTLVKKLITKEERDKKLLEFKKEQEKIMSVQKINIEVEKILKDKKMCLASDIEMKTIKDFVKVIYIRIFASSPLARYKIKSTSQITNELGYSFRNFQIWRK